MVGTLQSKLKTRARTDGRCVRPLFHFHIIDFQSKMMLKETCFINIEQEKY